MKIRLNPKVSPMGGMGSAGSMGGMPKIQVPGPMTEWTGVKGVGDPKLKTGFKKL